MNPRRRIEPEVLAVGREWTRVELPQRRPEQLRCAGDGVCANRPGAGERALA